MQKPSTYFVIIALAFFGLVSDAYADENRLFILQDSNLSSSVGNTLFVDQSLAVESIITGEIGSESFATQTGGGNSAEIEVVGSQGQVAFNQNFRGSGPINFADIGVEGLRAAGVFSQDGFDNDGSLYVFGKDARGELEQNGNGNVASLDVVGTDAFGRLVQNGDGNVNSLNVAGTGASVTVIQNGSFNGTTPSVTTNGGTVVITQTSNPIVGRSVASANN